MSDLKISEAYHDRRTDTVMIEGLSVDEMTQILNNHYALEEVMKKHGLGKTYVVWRDDWGIHSIKHFGGHLLVTIGNNCD